MNEEAIQQLYSLAKKEGYAKSIEEFKTLISSDEKALSNMYSVAKSEGYKREIDDFKALVGFDEGLKKKSLSSSTESDFLSQARPSVSESLSSEYVPKGTSPEFYDRQQEEIANSAAAELYTGIALSKGNIEEAVKDPNMARRFGFKNTILEDNYRVYKSLSKDPIAQSLPLDLLDESGAIKEGIMPILKKGTISFIKETLKEEEKRKERRGKERYTIPVISELTSGGEAIVGGVLKFAESLGAKTGELGDLLLDDSGKRAEDALITYGLSDEELSQGFIENFQDGNIKAGFAQLGSTLIQQTPQLFTAAMLGPYGLATLGASAAGSQYAAVQDRDDLSQADKMIYSLGVGGIEYLTEKLFLGDVNLLRKTFKKQGIKDLTSKELGDLMFGWLPKGARAVTEEGFEEVLANSTQGLLGKFIADDEIDPIEIVEGGVIGSLMGGGAFLISRGFSSIKSPEERKKIKAFEEALKQYDEVINNPEVSKEEKDLISNKRNEVQNALDNILKKVDESANKMSEEQKATKIDLQNSLRKARRDYSKMSTEIGKKEQENVISEIQKKIDALELEETAEAKTEETTKQEEILKEKVETKEDDALGEISEQELSSVTAEEQRDIDSFFDEANESTEVKSQNLAINKTGAVEQDESTLKSSVESIAQLGAKAISKILPNVKIVLHKTNDQYLKYAKLGEGRAEYNPENTTIHINLSKATNTTVPHEIFHAVLMEKVKTDPAIAKAAERMVLSVQKALPKNSELSKRIEAFAKQYEGQFQNEERLAELVGILSSEYRQLDKPSKNVIVEFLKSIARKFGIDIGVDFGKEDADVIDLLNVISRKTKKGEVIKESDIQSLEQEEQGSEGDVGTIRVPKQQKIEVIESPKVESDPRPWIRSLVQDIDINELEGRNFVTNMYDYTNAGKTDLGNGYSIDLLGGRNYVPIIMLKTGKKLGDVSNLAAFNSKAQAEGFIRNSVQGKANLFAPHSGTLDGSWQFQQHIFDQLVNLVLDNKILTKKELIDSFNSGLKSTGKSGGVEALAIFNEKNKSKLKNLNRFKKDPKELVTLLNIENNFSPNLRKILNQKIASNKKFQKAIGIKNLSGFHQKIMDPLNKGVVGGEIMTFIEFDPSTFEVVKTNPNDVDHHPSFGWAVKAKINRILQPNKFYKSYDVTEIYTKYNTDETVVSKNIDEKFKSSNVTSSAGSIPKVATVLSKAQRQQKIDDGLSKASGTTQVATTGGSYATAANIINGFDIEGDVLDYGAGLGLGTDVMSKRLGRKVDSFELNTERWEGKASPTYTSAKEINKKYDAVVSLNVVNVVPKDVRDFIVQDIFSKLNEGGTAIISSRGFKGDISNTKNFEKGPEEKSYIVKRKQKGKVIDVYQKGFDGNELVDYVQELLGTGAVVTKNNTFGKAGVVVTKAQQARQQKITGREQKNIESYILEARRNNFRDAVIKDYLVRVQKFPARLVNSLMSINIDVFDSMPKSFGDIDGGAQAGLKLFNRIRAFREKLIQENAKRDQLTPTELKKKISKFRKKKQEELKNNKKYIEQIKKEEGVEFVEMSEEVIKLKAKIEKEIQDYAQKQTEINDSKPPILTEQEILDKTVEFLEKQPEYKNAADAKTKAISTQQARMLSDMQSSVGIRPSQNLTSKISQARLALRERTKGARSLQKIKTEVRNFIRKALPKEIYTKGNVIQLIDKVNAATEGNINNILDEVTSFVIKTNIKALKRNIDGVLNGTYQVVENGRLKPKKISDAVRKRIDRIKSNLLGSKATPEEIGQFNESLLKRINELSQEVEQTVEQREEMVDLELAMKYNNSIQIENDNPKKVSELDAIYSTLGEMITFGKSLLQQELLESHQSYLAQLEAGNEAITGEYIDMSDPNVKNELNKKRKQRKGDEKRRRMTQNVVRRFFSGLFSRFDNFVFGSSEAMDGLMERIDKLPGEMFGGRLNEMFTDKVDEASIRFKMRMMEIESQIAGFLYDNYGKNWKKVSRLNRKQVDQGIELQEGVMLEPLSQDEIAYFYNMYKDPALRPSFANAEMWGVEVINSNDSAEEKERKQNLNKQNADRVMKDLEAKLEPKVKALADWQVDVLYPQLYEEYNRVYKKLYRTDLPWSEFYAGTVYREGTQESDLDIINLLGQGNMYKTAVGAGATKVRQNSRSAIKAMNQMDVLNTYINDMEYFAAYGEVVRDLDKFFSNKYIKSSIEDIHGKEIYSFIKDMIQKIASRGQQSGIKAKVINGMNNAFIISRLALSPVITIKQLISTFTYANDIGFRNWLKYAAKNKLQQMKVWKEVTENSVYMKDRNNQSIMTAIETYSDSRMKEFLPNSRIKDFISGPAKNWLVNFAMYTTKIGDRGAIMLGGLPNYSYYKDKALKEGKSEQEAIKIAIKKFERDTKRTQQSADLQDKDYLQTGDPLTRAMNMFLTTPKQYLRKEIIAIRNLYRAISGKDYKGTVGQNIRTFAMYHAFMPMLFQYVSMGLPGILRGWRDDDDEDLLRAGVIGNLNALFIIGEVVQTVGDYFTDKPWAGSQAKTVGLIQIANGVVKDLVKAGNLKDEEKKAKAYRDAYYELSTLVGLPMPTIAKFFDNYGELGSESDVGTIILRLLNYSNYQIEGPKKRGSGKSSKTMNDFYEKMRREREGS
jgi:hypothetical protein